MKLLAVIAVRGGSKGIKNKNIKDLNGKPLIVYTIKQVKKWGRYDKLIVSTDSAEIADIAKYYGAEVPFMRPFSIATDKAGKIDVLRHALSESEKLYNLVFDSVLDLDVTAPVRTVADIENAIRIFKDKNPDCVFSAVKSRKNPYFNMVEINEQGLARTCKQPKTRILRRQDAPVVYAMNTSIYVYSRKFLLNEVNKSVFSGKAYIYEMPEISAVDIDSEIDFKFIEFLAKEKIVIL